MDSKIIGENRSKKQLIRMKNQKIVEFKNKLKSAK